MTTPVLLIIAYLIDVVTVILNCKGIANTFVNVMLNVNIGVLLLLLGIVGTCDCKSDAIVGVVAICVIGAIFTIFFPFKCAMLYTSVLIGTVVILFMILLSLFFKGHN